MSKRILSLRFSSPAVIKAFKETVIFIMGNLFEETAGAEIHLAFGALPADSTDFSDGAVVTSTRDLRMLYSHHGIVHNLSIKKSY